MRVMSMAAYKKVACIVLVTWLLFLFLQHYVAVTGNKDNITYDDFTLSGVEDLK